MDVKSHDIAGEHARKLLLACLGTPELVPRNALMAYVGLDEDIVDRELAALAELGIVEALSPVSGGGDAREAWRRPDGTFYRMVRPTDRDYLWEQQLMAPRRWAKQDDVRDLRLNKGREDFGPVHLDRGPLMVTS